MLEELSICILLKIDEWGKVRELSCNKECFFFFSADTKYKPDVSVMRQAVFKLSGSALECVFCL